MLKAAPKIKEIKVLDYSLSDIDSLNNFLKNELEMKELRILKIVHNLISSFLMTKGMSD